MAARGPNRIAVDPGRSRADFARLELDRYYSIRAFESSRRQPDPVTGGFARPVAKVPAGSHHPTQGADMKVAIAGFVGGLILFVWGAVSHTALPLGHMGMARMDPQHEDVV